MANSVQQELVSLALRYARLTRDEDHLQAGDILYATYYQKWQELRQTYASRDRERVWMLSSAADVLYYAACIDAQATGLSEYEAALKSLSLYGVTRIEAETAALAKYRLQDVDNAHAAIEAAIAALPKTTTLVTRDLSSDIPARLGSLARELGYSTREPFIRELLEAIAAMTAEQVKQFLAVSQNS